MVGATWLSWPFSGLMVISAVCHTGRLVAARQHGRTQGWDLDVTHLVTSAAMAVMLVIAFGVHLATTLLVLVGVTTLWFILRALQALISNGRRAVIQPGQQVLMGAAMLFMLIVAGKWGSVPTLMTMNGIQMPGMAPGDNAADGLGAPSPSVAAISLVLQAVICLVAARHARHLRVAVVNRRSWRMEPTQELRQRAAGVLLGPELSLGSQLAMSGTMIFMLVRMT